MALLPMEDALVRILRNAKPRPARVPLAAADGLRLAADIVADRDLPPFHRSTLDGYALNTGDPAVRRSEALAVQEVVYAGSPARKRLRPGCATLVMTGAPVPSGADAVLRREDARPLDDGGFVLPLATVRKGVGIHSRGGDALAGDLVLTAGTVVTPGVVAVLASLGEARPLVFGPPRVSVAVTGDEIRPVATGRLPAAAIRNSNGPTLAALVRGVGGVPDEVGVAGDDLAALRALARRAMKEADIVLFTGGVSAGDKDLVPPVLEGLGVKRVFHKLDLRPGKPVWFGVKGTTLVFGLPGNPVSTQVAFHLLVAPAMRALRGEEPGPVLERAFLEGTAPQEKRRTAFLPARLRTDRTGRLRARLLPWNGSGDFAGFAAANALVRRAGGAPPAKNGSAVQVVRLRQPVEELR